MGHHHHHHHQSNVKGRGLLITILLNLLLSLAELIGGVLSGSLALLSDAMHNFSDTFSLILAYIANKTAQLPSSNRRTYGSKRIEILSAFTNSLVLLLVCGYIIIEAIDRFYFPEKIDVWVMLPIAIFGLLGNFISMILLHRDAKESLNVKAAYLHLLADTLSSVAVVAGGVILIFWDIPILDPILSIVICLFILKQTYHILRQSFDILMQTTPKEIDVNELEKSLSGAFVEVKTVHHTHIWSLNEKDIFLEAHISLENDITVSATKILRDKISKVLHNKYHITHTTFQFEYGVDEKECDRC